MDLPDNEPSSDLNTKVKKDYSLWKNIEEGLFGILYTMETGAGEEGAEDQLKPNRFTGYSFVLLEAIQILGFSLLASAQWGTFINTLAPYIIFFQFRIVHLFHLEYDGFQAVFWILVFATFSSLAISVVVGIAFLKRHFSHVWPVRFLKVVISFFYKILFINNFDVITLAFICNPSTQALASFPQVPCYTQNFYLEAAVGHVTLIILAIFSITSTCSDVSLVPKPMETLICTTPFFNIHLQLSFAFLTLNFNLLSPFVYGPWWEYLIGFGVNILLLYHLYRLLPYQNAEINELRGGALAITSWTALMAFFSVNSGSNVLQVTRVPDILVFAGFVPMFLLGRALIRYRYQYIETLAKAVTNEFLSRTEEDLMNSDVNVNANSKSAFMRKQSLGMVKNGPSNDMTAGAMSFGNFFSPLAKINLRKENLPKSLNYATIRNNFYLIEMVTRVLWQHPNANSESVDAANFLFKRAVKAFPESAFLMLAYSYFLESLNPDDIHANFWRDRVSKNLKPRMDLRFLLFKQNMSEAQNKAKRGSGTDNEKFDLVAYVEYQKYYREARKFHKRVVESIRRFWGLFLSENGPEGLSSVVTVANRKSEKKETKLKIKLPISSSRKSGTISFDAFIQAARKIEHQTAKADEFYSMLTIRYPKAHHIHESYAVFLETVLKDTAKATRERDAARELQGGLYLKGNRGMSESGEMASTVGSNSNQDMHKSGENDENYFESNAVISIDENGLIKTVNEGVLAIFGYQKKDLIGKNISVLLPHPFKEKHNGYLQRYKDTGEARVIGKEPRELFGLHKQGYVFPVKLRVTEVKLPNGRPSFIGMVSPAKTKGRKKDSRNGMVLIKADGTILMINKKIIELFGYNPHELIKRNVKILMPDEHAIRHDQYLKSYIETGIAKVIGKKARNVFGKHKTGKTFPMALELEEQMIDNHKYFISYITDVTNISSNIFINSKGIVQTCDEEFSRMFGYDKDEILGQNINIIMPYPYSEYHDSYLERYMSTRVGMVVNNPEGRNLKALHKDGYQFNIHLVVESIETEREILFKGTITRTNATSEQGAYGTTTAEDLGDDSLEIDMNNGMITFAGNNVCAYVGYKETFLKGRSVEMIIPPLPQYEEQRDIIRDKCQSNPGKAFYARVLHENMSIKPATITFMGNEKNNQFFRFKLQSLLQTEGLITISEKGIILEYNRGASDLFGYPPGEVAGRNLKMLMPPEVAENHDGYLQRYLDTHVARVVGTRRSVTARHSDGSLVPIELEVAEIRPQTVGEGEEVGPSNFMARIRHAAPTEKASRDWFNELNLARAIVPQIRTKDPTITSITGGNHSKKVSVPSMRSSMAVGEEDNLLKSAGNNTPAFRAGSELNFQKNFSLPEEKGEDSDNNNNDEQDNSPAGLMAKSEKENEENDDENNSSIAAIQKRLAAIGKRTLKVEAAVPLKNAAYATFFLFTILFIVAQVMVATSIASPLKYVTLSRNQADFIITLNDVLTFTQIMKFQQSSTSSNIVNCIWSMSKGDTTLSADNGTWSNSVCSNSKCCLWFNSASMNAVANEFPATINLLQDKLNTVLLGCSDLMVDTSLTSYLAQPFALKVFNSNSVNGTVMNYTDYWAVMEQVISSGKVLSNSGQLQARYPRELNFLLANQDQLLDMSFNLLSLIIPASETDWNHIILLGICDTAIQAIFLIMAFSFLIYPRFNWLNSERVRVFNLLLLIPRSAIYSLAYDKQEIVSDDENENIQSHVAEISAPPSPEIGRRGSLGGKALSRKASTKSAPANDKLNITIRDDSSRRTILLMTIQILSILLPMLLWVAIVQGYGSNRLALLGKYSDAYDNLFYEGYDIRRQTLQSWISPTPDSITQGSLLQIYYEIDASYSLMKLSPTFAKSQAMQTLWDGNVCLSTSSAARCQAPTSGNYSLYLPENLGDFNSAGLRILYNFVMSKLNFMGGFQLSKNITDPTWDEQQIAFWYIWEYGGDEFLNGISQTRELYLQDMALVLNMSVVGFNVASSIAFAWSFMVFFFFLRKTIIRLENDIHHSRQILITVPLTVIQSVPEITKYLGNLSRKDDN